MRLHHLALRVRDVARVAAFYQDVLGLEPRAAPRDGVRWLGLGDAILMIEPSSGAADADRPSEEPFEPGRPGLHLIALAIGPGDGPAWRRRLAAGGVPVERETVFTLYVRDPEGNRVGLSSWPEALGSAASP